MLRIEKLRVKIVSLVSIFMAVWAVLVCVISKDWSFPRAPSTPALKLWENKEQYQFEIWLWDEMTLIWCYIFGTMMFLIF